MLKVLGINQELAVNCGHSCWISMFICYPSGCFSSELTDTQMGAEARRGQSEKSFRSFSTFEYFRMTPQAALT